MTQLTNNEFLRYNRQIMLEKIGEQGQMRLKQARAMIIGMGGLGCPAAQYLAASGVGTLVLVDHDVIELSNLQRQILYTHQDIGHSKVEVAQHALDAINPWINIQIINDSILNLSDPQLQPIDVVLDCTDTPQTREFINRLCVKNQLKLVSASAIQEQGQLISFDFKQPDSPCYQCLFTAEPEQVVNCTTSGVISPLLGIMGSLQATSALHLLLDQQPELNNLLTVHSGTMQFKKFKVHKNPDCRCCA